MALNRQGSKTALAHVLLARPPLASQKISADTAAGLKYRAWLSENGVSVFGFDNHKPKGPHLHAGDRELGYLFRGYDELMKDIRKMIEEEGFIYEE